MPRAERERPTALLVTRNLPPLRGGMERLVGRMSQLLSDDFALSVIGPSGCSRQLPRDVRAREVPCKPLWKFLLNSTFAAWKESGFQAIDLVVAGSGLTAPQAWLAARRSRARLTIYLHGLDIIAPSWVYQRFWLPFIRRADLVLVNSHNTRRLAIERGVPERIIDVLHPGTDLPGPDTESRGMFRETHGLADRPVMLSVGRLTPRKGLAEFVAHALPRILAHQPDAILVVVGGDADDAVRTPVESEQARILRVAQEVGVAAAVRLLPPCDDATLSAAYRAADTYVFPVLDVPGDVEGFGMVAIEAAAHGLPTVGFAVGGVPDAIVDGSSGSLVEPGDYDRFAREVEHWLVQSDPQRVQARCLMAAEAFSWDRFGERLRGAIQSLLRVDA